MKLQSWESVRENRRILLERYNLDFAELARQLGSRKVFTYLQEKQILDISDPRQQTDMFFTVLFSTNPERAFDIFLEELLAMGREDIVEYFQGMIAYECKSAFWASFRWRRSVALPPKKLLQILYDFKEYWTILSPYQGGKFGDNEILFTLYISSASAYSLYIFCITVYLKIAHIDEGSRIWLFSVFFMIGSYK